MKKTKRKSKVEKEDMLPEYDFTGQKGVRGKYYHAYQQGHAVRINKKDGSQEVRYYTLQEGAILLAPDVQKYFPDSASVNKALRALISLVPESRSLSKS